MARADEPGASDVVVGRWIVFETCDTTFWRPYLVTVRSGISPEQVRSITEYLRDTMPDSEGGTMPGRERVCLNAGMVFRYLHNTYHYNLIISFRYEADRVAFLLRWSDI